MTYCLISSHYDIWIQNYNYYIHMSPFRSVALNCVELKFFYKNLKQIAISVKTLM